MVMILGGLRDWRHDAPENDFGKGLCVNTTQSRDTAPRHVSGGALVQCARRFTKKVAPCKVIVRRGCSLIVSRISERFVSQNCSGTLAAHNIPRPVFQELRVVLALSLEIDDSLKDRKNHTIHRSVD